MTLAEQKSAFTSRGLRDALGFFPTGVTIVTTLGATPDDVIGVTLSSFSSVSMDPPLILFSVDRQARSLPAFENATGYAINVLGHDHGELSNRFAKQGADKWEGVSFRSGHMNVPLIEGAIAHFECDPYASYDGGDHVIFLAHVLRFSTADEASPLVFYRGKYRHLAVVE